jgi:peptide deformylase
MQAREVDEFDDDLVRLVARMTRLMTDANGVGLAATQVGILQRVFVFRSRDEETVNVVVNPQIVERGPETEVDEEGCLSLQGVLVPVERNLRVTVEGRDETGGEVRFELEALTARVAQHELDHLDGVLILDRTTAESRREALAVLRPRVALA